MDRFFIIDGNSLAYRAYYAMPYLSTKDKKPSGAVFGFSNLLAKLIAEHKPKYVAVAFDHARQTFRNKIFADYKGTRKETPPDLKEQFPVIRGLLEKMNIKYFESSGIEADDIIGTLAKNSQMENVLLTGDRDLLQLIDDHTTVWLMRKGVSDIEHFDREHLMEVFGIEPFEVVDLKALMGDSSDNIPGVAGVGEKTALDLLSKYDGIDGVYQHIDEIKGKLKEKLIAGKDSAYMSQKLATIKTDCKLDFDINDCVSYFPYSQEVFNFFVEWDFRTLIRRKDLYVSTVREMFKDVEQEEISSLAQMECLVKSIENVFCYDFKNLKFYLGGEKVFSLKKEADLFSQSLEIEDVLNSLKPVFENDKILKITNDAKFDIKILNRQNIRLNNFFDLEIAKYVLNAGLPKERPVEIYDYISQKDKLFKQMQDLNVLKVYSEIEIPLVSVLANMELEGFKINEEELNELAEKYTQELEFLRSKIFELAGEEFNLNSSPQVANILFDKLGLKAFNNKKRSTSFQILDDIRWQHEIVDLIIQFRKVNKLVSTYLSVYQTICKRDGAIVKTIFNQTLTSTGRLSSSEPNMQNIPTRDEESKSLRKIFVSKFDNGKIVSADYSQIELRLLANMAQEDGMIEAYKNGVDIHTKTASEIFDVPISQVTAAQRQDAKAINFGIIYGMSDFGLSQSIKTTRMDAKQYIDNYFNRYNKIKVYMDKNVEFAKENGYVLSYFGRVRHIPEISSSNGMTRRFGERVAMNTPLQATASDVIKLAMIEVAKAFETQNLKSHLILQVHDELIVDAVAEEVDKVEKILKEKMESVCNFEVPLTVSVSSGSNLFDCK